MMNDADDQHNVIVHNIEYPMFAVDEAANTLAEFGYGGASERIAAQQVEGSFKTISISIGNLASEPFFAIVVNCRKVSPRRRTKFNVSHAARDVQQRSLSELL